jgi:hypothetical protein
MTTDKATPRTAGRLGGLASAANMTPEQRQARARRAHLAGAVRAVITNLDRLTEEQTAQLRAALCP